MKTRLIGLLLLSMTLMVNAQTNAPIAPPFSTEEGLIERYETDIKAFWEQGRFSSFTGVDNIDIQYAEFVSESNKQCIVLVPGRTEGYLKYKELSFDLVNQGFNLFIIDHRGQGLSGKMLSNPEKGYVELFDHYSDDLHYFVDNIVQSACDNEIFLLAHSMGGAISARYLQRYVTPIKAAMLASPMIAINSGGIPNWLAEFIIASGDNLAALLGKESWYFLGQGDYSATPFADNALMQSSVRYQIFTDLYANEKALQLGGVTYHWLSEAIAVNKAIFSDISKLKVPTQVMQAGADTVVDNQAQDDFCAQLHQANPNSCPAGKPLVIENARHEIFFELDKMRIPGIEATLAWFKQHSEK